MAKRLEGKVALVTGGASGLGKAMATRFAAEGAAVVIADIHEEGGTQVVAEIERTGGSARFVETDVSRAEDCERVVGQAIAQFGQLDIMVNNAGTGVIGSVAELPEADWDRVLAVNLKGVFLGSKYAFPVMARGGGGVILNTASAAGMIAHPGFAAYGASKAAVIHLTRITAMEGAAFNIRANALCPIWIETPMVEAYVAQFPDQEAARRAMAAGVPLGRIGAPADVAEAALYLVSDSAAFITGVAFPIDGGATAGVAPRRDSGTRRPE
jgi:NAD(P)-dependent dehydrogenase (short-subunit alcohol dehydrogenase family)